MKALYRLEDNHNLTFITRIDDRYLTDVTDEIIKYLDRNNIEYDELKARSGYHYYKAGGIRFYVVNIID